MEGHVQSIADGHHGRPKREDGKRHGTPGLPEKNAPWHLRCANCSPRYTTHWDELMKAYTDEGQLGKIWNKRYKTAEATVKQCVNNRK